MGVGALISELKRRRVFRVLVGYGIVSFAVLQIIEPIMHALHLPDVTLTYVVLALAVGFPVAVVLAWAFDINEGRIERTEPVAPHALKGIRLTLVLLGIGLIAAAPGVVWYFVLPGHLKGPQEAATATAPTTASPSIAVLPFVNLSSDKEQEYFSDGIAEEILNALAQVEGLKVIGRTSSFSFKGKNEDLRSIGEKLSVANVLEGSVRKEGNRVRITAQLIEAAGGSHLWSQTYDRELNSIFAVQDEIAKDVVTALKVKLLPEKAKGERKTTSPEAYEKFLLGMQLMRNGADNKIILPVWESALSLDPAYAPAWAMAALASWNVRPPGESPAARAARDQKAISTAQRAVTLDPNSADALAIRGSVRRVVLWDWDGARTDLERARALAPSSAYVARFYAHLLKTLGRAEDALRTYQLAVDLDPLDKLGWEWLGEAYLDDGQYSSARSAYQRSFDLSSPKDEELIAGIAGSYVLERQLELASAWTGKLSDEKLRLYATADLEFARGHKKEAEAVWDSVVAKDPLLGPFRIATHHAWWGQIDLAFEWLDRAYAAHDDELQFVKSEVTLKPLHGDPRFKALLKKMNLPLD